MRLRVIVLGGDAKDPLQQAAADYLSRCGRRYDAGLVELKPAKRGKGADDDAVKDAEASALLKASDGCTRIAMDKGGAQPSSEAFAASVESWMAKGKPVAFLIGGATGLSPRVLEASQHTLSLSAMTYAHRLAVCVLAEQLYRASEIARGGPYHK